MNIITGESGQGGDGSGPDGVLAELAQLPAARAEIERREAALVRRARNEGIVWEQIAASLGVSRQAVHKKYRAGTAWASRRSERRPAS